VGSEDRRALVRRPLHEAHHSLISLYYPVSLLRFFTRKRMCRDNRWLERISQQPCIPVGLYRSEEAGASELRWLLGEPSREGKKPITPCYR
jgi:hypothetical protein